MLIKTGEHIPRRLLFYENNIPRPDPNNVIGYSIERLCNVCLQSNGVVERNQSLCSGCNHYKEED